MALSGLNCPKCEGNLLDEAASCHHCGLPIGQREWKLAIANEYLKAHENTGTFRLLVARIRFSFWLKKRSVAKFFSAIRTFLRRQIVVRIG